jgi:hypothetical protein
MSNRAEINAPIEAEPEETSLEPAQAGDRKEPKLDTNRSGNSSANPRESAFDAEFDDVSMEVEQESTTERSLAVSDVPLQDRPVPRISIEAFCKSPDNGAVMQQVASDRRLSRAHVAVHMGGIHAAVQHFSVTPTPNLILVEASIDHEEIFKGLEELASVCDAGTKVIVIGQVNDIILYRELIRQGGSQSIRVASFVQRTGPRQSGVLLPYDHLDRARLPFERHFKVIAVPRFGAF